MKQARLIVAITAFFATCLFSMRSQAQEMVTVHMTPEGYNQVIAQNEIGGTLTQQTADNSFMVVVGSNPYDPPVIPWCPDQLTPALAAHMQSMANSCCCRVYICVQRSNCAWWLMFFDPNNGCMIQAPYQEAVQAYRF